MQKKKYIDLELN